MRLKLVSPKDSLLGHVDVPDCWAASLTRRECIEFAIMPRLHYPLTDDVSMLPLPDCVQTVTLAQARWSHYRGAVFLARGTLEEFEKLDGCSFAPSLEFLKSHLT